MALRTGFVPVQAAGAAAKLFFGLYNTTVIAHRPETE
jgi:hypothetical protein